MILISIDDKLKKALIQSSKKYALEIASKTKEKQELESKFKEYNDKLLISEAKIEVYREKRDSINKQVAEKKIMKGEYFNKRDEFLQNKRMLQQELYDINVPQTRKDVVKEKLNDLSEKIGIIIEDSKKISEEMQELHELSQVEHKNMKNAQDELYLLKRDSDKVATSIRRKISEIDNELSGLRRKMSDIQKKLK